MIGPTAIVEPLSGGLVLVLTPVLTGGWNYGVQDQHGNVYISGYAAENRTARDSAASRLLWLKSQALSPRQLEVWRLVAGGLHLDEIAGSLGVGISTVRTAQARAAAKLDLRNTRLELGIAYKKMMRL